MNEAIDSVTRQNKEIKITEGDAERFWSGVNIDKSLDNCWEWVRSRNKAGYGKFWINGRDITAHRASWILANGQIPCMENGRSLFVCHKCDNPACVNPNHLFLGTPLDNARDMAEKGRAASGDNNGSRKRPERLRRGENHPMRLRPDVICKGEQIGTAKLAASDILEMRSMHAQGTPSRKIAKLFGMGKTQVLRIVNRVSWAHLP